MHPRFIFEKSTLPDLFSPRVMFVTLLLHAEPASFPSALLRTLLYWDSRSVFFLVLGGFFIPGLMTETYGGHSDPIAGTPVCLQHGLAPKY